ncbi:hypothetical protein WOC76_12500 [Methylocystis sp. IM3]|uniref:hypothetical protein n=1 Tax=unclassified Methylocystis TaxID=2625913 RepID=UPI0030F6144A
MAAEPLDQIDTIDRLFELTALARVLSMAIDGATSIGREEKQGLTHAAHMLEAGLARLHDRLEAQGDAELAKRATP